MLKIITYNTLAQRYFEPQLKHKYPYITNPEIILWNNRLVLIKDKILSCDPDIICLQEVELATISDIIAYFSDSYDNFKHTIDKKRNSPIGNIIFWKRKYNMTNPESNSCGIFVTIQNIRIGNIHLKAGFPLNEDTRTSQLNSCIKKFGLGPGMICGDFNDELNPFGSLKKILDTNKFSCYVDWPTCCIYMAENIFNYMSFDHVVSIGIQIEPIKTNIPDKIPNEIEPSDHILVQFGLG